MKFIAERNGRIQQGDQGALNAVLSHDTYCFGLRFNSVTIFCDFTYKEMIIYRKLSEFHTEAKGKEAMENPAIIHFTTSFKSKRVWMNGCKHRYVGEWLKYKEISPWKDNRPEWKQKALKVYMSLPSWLTVRIASVMQVYGRPMMNKVKK